MYEDITDDVEQLEIYLKRLQEYIDHHREEFILLLEEKKRIELTLKMYGRE